MMEGGGKRTTVGGAAGRVVSEGGMRRRRRASAGADLHKLASERNKQLVVCVGGMRGLIAVTPLAPDRVPRRICVVCACARACTCTWSSLPPLLLKRRRHRGSVGS